MKQEYPKAVYNAAGECIAVQSVDEHEAAKARGFAGSQEEAAALASAPKKPAKDSKK